MQKRKTLPETFSSQTPVSSSTILRSSIDTGRGVYIRKAVVHCFMYEIPIRGNGRHLSLGYDIPGGATLTIRRKEASFWESTVSKDLSAGKCWWRSALHVLSPRYAVWLRQDLITVLPKFIVINRCVIQTSLVAKHFLDARTKKYGFQWTRDAL